MDNVNAYILLLVLLIVIGIKVSESGFACLSNPCIHGVCLDDLNSTYSCYCIDGYTGIQCQTNWDECWSNPCQNGGVCQDGVAAFNCTCPSGFAGDLCEENLNECMSNPCQNNASCLDAANGYTCNCPPGYSGVHCELDVAVCNLTNEARCSNGGVCVEGPGFTFNCRCLDGWTGLLCELEIDECMSHPCQNGAVCVDLLANYECACTFGYAGRNCEETVLLCEDNPCRNDALCLMEDDKPVCYCVPDYHGERCQFQYDECKLSNNRCLNEGSCIDGVDGFTCSCPPKLTGVYCECLIIEIRGTIYLDCSSISAFTSPMPNNTTYITDIITLTSTTLLPITSTTEVTVVDTMPTSNVPITLTTTSEASTTEIDSTTLIPTALSTIEETTIATTVSISSFSQTSPSTQQTTEIDTSVTTETTNYITTSTTELINNTTSTTQTSTLITTEESTTQTSTIQLSESSESTITSMESTTATNSPTTESVTTAFHVVETSTELLSTTTISSTDTERITSSIPMTSSSSAELTSISSLPTSTPFTSTETIPSTTETTEIIDNTNSPTTMISTGLTEVTNVDNVTEPIGFPHITDFVPTTSSSTPSTTFQATTSITTSSTRDTTNNLLTTSITDLTEETESTSLFTPSVVLFDCSKTDQSCLNGGTCIYSDGFHCACHYDFSGKRCENTLGIENAAFNSHSYILHRMQTYNRSQMEVQFTARTSWGTGVLFYASIQDSYMALYAEHAHLKFKFSCGYQTMLLSELNKPIDNGNEMRISALLTFSDDRHHCNASIKLNDTLTMSGAQIANKNQLFRFKMVSYLYLGGLSQKAQSMLKLPGFIGCISDLTIGGKSVRIFKDAEDAFGVSECSSLACLSNPCKNGATCATIPGTTLDKYVCKCLNGFVGKQCDKTVCENNPCKFGGTCLPFTGSGYLCLCPYGKHGHFCENDIKISKAYYSSSVQGYASFTSHPIPKTPYKQLYIKFKITPSNLNQIALLLFVGQEGHHDFYSSHMAVSFVKGFIMLTWNLGAGPRRIFTEKAISADKANYEIQIGRIGRRAWLHVEHLGNVTGRSQGTSTQMEIEPFLYFGGYKTKRFEGLPHDLPLHSGFSGCIFDMEFKIGDVTISLDNGKVAGRAIGQCGTTECYEGVCQNNGACLYHGGTFTCMCQDGLYGPLCSNKFNLCDQSSCAPSATCVPMIAGYECDCPLGKKGRYCQENETLSDIRFTGIRSYLILPPRIFEANKFNFDLELRPLTDGLVAFVGNHDYFFSLTMTSGILELRLLPSRHRRHKRERLVLRSNKLLRLGMWHQIKVQVYGRKVYLFVDNIVNTAILQIGDNLDLSNENIYLGGLADMSLLPQEATCEFPTFYKGCIRKLFIDDHHVPLNEKTIFKAQNVEDCDGTPCGGDYCTNGGTCWLDPNLKPHCNCPDPYYGDKCEKLYNCIQHKCKNNGYCLEGKCVCRVGYVGALCETGLTIRRPKFVGRSYLYVNASHEFPPPIEIGSNTAVISGKKRNSIAESKDAIGITFTTASDGLLVFANESRWFALGLQNGKLTLVNDNNNMEIFSSPTLNDGFEHELLLMFLPFRVYIDHKGYNVGNFSFVEFKNFYLGGVPNDWSWMNNIVVPFAGFMFDGCIHMLTTDKMQFSNENIIDFNSYKGENVDECSKKITEPVY